MNHHIHSSFVRHRTYLGEEIDEVLLQSLTGDVLVSCQLLFELLQCEGLFGTGQTHNHHTRQTLLVFFRHLSETRLGACNLFLRVVLFCTLAAENKEVESDICRFFEHQPMTAIGEHVVKVGTRPVQNGHEVVRHHLDSARTEITQGLFVVLNISEIFPLLGLDMFVNRHGLHTRPLQTCGFDFVLAFHDFLYRPYLPVGDMMECRDDTGSAGHANIGEADRILRTIPAHGLFAQIHRAIYHLVIYHLDTENVKTTIYNAQSTGNKTGCFGNQIVNCSA